MLPMAVTPKPAPRVKPMFQFVGRNAVGSGRAGDAGATSRLSVGERMGASCAGTEHTQSEFTKARTILRDARLSSRLLEAGCDPSSGPRTLAGMGGYFIFQGGYRVCQGFAFDLCRRFFCRSIGLRLIAFAPHTPPCREYASTCWNLWPPEAEGFLERSAVAVIALDHG